MFKICRHQLRMALASPRFYIALFMGCAIQIVGIMPLLEYAQGMGKPLSLLEGFVCFSCERYTISAVFLSIVFLVSDIPFSSENETYTLLRVSRKKWLAGKVLYLFCACVLFYLVVLLAGMAFLSADAYVGNFWSEPFYYLSQNKGIGEYSAYFPYPHVLLLRPLQAVLIAISLNVAYGFTMSLFLFFCNLKLPKTLGYAVTMLLHAVFYMILSAFQSSYYARYSLLGNSLLMYHSIGGQYSELLPSLSQSFLVFGVTIAVLIILIFIGIRKYDFRITVGAKQ
ncbi:MAG: hypothetical protein J1E03_12360 [Acetatifactor sp.]|nr:hypothetical protein [Acetatifactor sp.]